MKFFLLPITLLVIYSMGLLVATLPFVTGDVYNEKRFFEIILLLVTLLSHVFVRYQFPISPFYKLLLIGVICLGLISVTAAQASNYAFIEFTIFTALLCYAVFVSNLHKYYEDIVRYYTYVVMYAAFLYFFVFIISYFAALTHEVGYDWDELFFGFVNIRFFNQYQIWLLPFMTLALLHCKAVIWTRVIFVITVIWWALLFLSVARGAMLAIVCTGILLLVIYGNTITKYLKLHAALAIVGWAVNLILFHLIPDLIREEYYVRSWLTVDSPERLKFWGQALIMIKENALLGIGPMHFSLETLNHPHSSVLQWGGEWGIPSLILMVTLSISALRAWFISFNKIFYKRNQESELANETLALTYAVVSGLGYSLVSGVIVMPLSQITMFTTVGLMLGHYWNYFPAKIYKPFVKHELVIWRGFILILTVLFVAALNDIGTQDRIMGKQQSLEKINVHGPRLWRIGGIPHD